ncbi:unnamed protein product, partial [Rotaria sp. Silwood1]
MIDHLRTIRSILMQEA